MLNIALPKGRLGEKVYAMFAKAGFECPALMENSRKLIFDNEEAGVRYFWVKPSDVAIYVERGAADIGVAGKDILLEYQPDVYELLDLNVGKCRMAVAAPAGFRDDMNRTLRVATKFSRIARNYYSSMGRIVETGTTLRENNLSVIEEIVPISARLIANKSGFKFRTEQIEKLTEGLRKEVQEA